jgi:oligoribonuclease
MLLWMDTETTGLDPLFDLLLEVAWDFTYDDLTPTKNMSGNHVIKADADFSESMMIPFVRQMHLDNGLLQHLRDAGLGKSGVETSLRSAVYRDLESQIKQVKEDTGETVTLAGYNPAFDKSFLETYMPNVDKELDYHTYDVSTLKKFFSNSGSLVDLTHGVPDKGTQQHRAKSDMEHALETATYLQTLIKEIK